MRIQSRLELCSAAVALDLLLITQQAMKGKDLWGTSTAVGLLKARARAMARLGPVVRGIYQGDEDILE